ncbi:MAG: hypothetical protein L6R36_008929 [Xanthoria steineri]|nr:MAG: hypothetical protein L6R36_008929 [Xanthoria steineri]
MGDLGGWLPAIPYCITANARYGYLITDQELLAIRISWLESAGKTLPKTTREEEVERRQRKGNLEYKAIPWTNDASEPSSSTHGLTINLALWWLHTMAAISHQIEDYDHALKADPRNPSDENEAWDRFGDSEEREAQTPPSNKRQYSFKLKHGQSFSAPRLPMSGTSCRLRLWTGKQANQLNSCGDIGEEKKERDSRFR